METPKLSFKTHLRRIEKMMDQTPTNMDNYCELNPVNRTPKPVKSSIHDDIVRLHFESPFLSTPVKTVGLTTSTPMPSKSLSTIKKNKKVNRILFNGATPQDLKNGSYNQSEMDELSNRTKDLELSDKKKTYSKLLMKSMKQSANISEVDRSWLTLA